MPSGGEDDYVVLEEVGTPRDFAAEGFEPRDHLELGELLGAIDTARGAKVSGARFYYLTGQGARLELGLLNLAMARAIEAGFSPMVVPTLVKPEVMAGAGFLDAHASEVYRLEADDLYLTGTSEVALAGYHADEILDLSGGPMRYAGWSTCYRREAGSHGKDTRGIIRVHQFQKIEMFSYCAVEDAAAEHQRLLAFERSLLDAVELPYRVIDVAAGDLGGPAARKYDCEAWVPTQGRHRELTSTSNCTTYQARRLGIRERDPERDGADPSRRDAQRHRGHDPLAGRDPREPPAGRRLGRRPRGAAAVRRPGGPRAGRPPVSDWTPALVALDVDGTILDHDGELSDRVRSAVQAVAASGRHVVISTGRSLVATTPVLDRLEPHQRLRRHEQRRRDAAARPVARRRLRARRRHDVRPARGPHAAARAPARGGVRRRGPRPRLPPHRAVPGRRAHRHDDHRAVRGAARGPGDACRGAQPGAHARAVPGDHRATSACTAAATRSAGPPGSTSPPRASARRTGCRWSPRRWESAASTSWPWATAATTWRCSRWAGRSVAMGQAPPEVQEQADEVCADVYADGLADVLEKLLTEELP